MVQNKSLFITYFLWLFFGWFGVHHFYLGRDRQAFAWWSTLGGVCLLGWIRDLWRIPDYVEDANETEEFLQEFTRKLQLRKYPRFQIVRFAGQLMVGYFYGILVRMALPEETPYFVVGVLVSVGVTTGTHMIGNIGREQGGLKFPFLATLTCFFLLSFLTSEEASCMYCSLAATCTFQYFREYRQTYRRNSLCKRVLLFSWCMFIIMALWMCFFYFNAEITTDDGETIKIRDSVNHFFKSPAWLEFKSTVWELYEQGKKHGWKNIYDELIKALDPKGEANARKVLGVNETASNEEIKRIYKKLVRKWHPDKNKEKKEEAQQKFMEIQEAYDILTSRKNSKSRQDSERTEF